MTTYHIHTMCDHFTVAADKRVRNLEDRTIDFICETPAPPIVHEDDWTPEPERRIVASFELQHVIAVIVGDAGKKESDCEHK